LSPRCQAADYRLPRELFKPAPTLARAQGCPPRIGRAGHRRRRSVRAKTLARLVMALEAPDAGRVVFDGQDLGMLDRAGLRRARAGFQMVFQDPYGSLDPRRKVWQTVAEPLAMLQGAPRSAQREGAAGALDAVGLRARSGRVPHEFSGAAPAHRHRAR
jgi:peptide/nickel transport system ATP-binding protein